MEMNGEQILKKAKKTPLGIKIAYIVCIVALLAAAGMIIYKTKYTSPEPVDFIAAESSEEGIGKDEYAYLDVEGLTYEVAIYGDTSNEKASTNDRYYLAISNNLWYIVDLNYETINKLKQIQNYTYSSDENATKPESVRITGMTEEIPKELKKLVLEYYNESVGEENKISEEEFSTYFGNLLLNVRKEPINVSIEELIIMFGFIGLFIIIIVHISLMLITKRTQKYIKTNGYEDDIAQQLDDFVEEKHYKDKVILTKDYLVDLLQTLVVFKYSDVKWIHIHTLKSYGVVTISSSIIVHLKDGKTNLQCVEVKHGQDEEFLQIFNKLCEKVPADALKGYSQENIKAFNEYKKELKRNK